MRAENILCREIFSGVGQSCLGISGTLAVPIQLPRLAGAGEQNTARVRENLTPHD